MSSAWSFSRHLVKSLCVLLSFSGFALAQITSIGDDTSTPIPGAGHDYMKMVNETVNPANGSVSIRIGVPMPPGRGLTLPFYFAYDSNGVRHMMGDSGAAEWYSSFDRFSEGGWSYTVPRLNFVSNDNYPDPGYPGENCTLTNDFVYSDAGG